MSQSSPQFTAAEILEAGRQAEAGGNRDYAIQFYRHLSDNYPQSAEAAGAREAMSRLLGYYAPQAAPPIGQAVEPVSAAAAGFVPGQAAAVGMGGAPGAGFLPDHGLPTDQGTSYSNGAASAGANGSAAIQPFATPLTRPAPRPGSAGSTPTAPFESHSVAATNPFPAPPPHMERTPPIPSQFLLPTLRNYYRIGQFLATILGIVGWIMLILGVAAILAGMGVLPGLEPAVVQQWVPGVPVQYGMLAGVLVGAAWLITGLMMIFFAQLSRAIFDNANATRDLVAIERAKVRQSAT